MVFSEFVTVICCCLILDLTRTEKRKVDDKKIGREEKEGIFVSLLRMWLLFFSLTLCGIWVHVMNEPFFNHNF